MDFYDEKVGSEYGDSNPLIVKSFKPTELYDSEIKAIFDRFHIKTYDESGREYPRLFDPQNHYLNQEKGAESGKDLALIQPDPSRMRQIKKQFWQPTHSGLHFETMKEGLPPVAKSLLQSLIRFSHEGEIGFHAARAEDRVKLLPYTKRIGPFLGLPIVKSSIFIKEAIEKFQKQFDFSDTEINFIRNTLSEIIKKAPLSNESGTKIGLNPSGVLIRWKKTGKGADNPEFHTDSFTGMTATVTFVGYSTEILVETPNWIKIVRPNLNDIVYMKRGKIHRASSFMETPRFVMVVTFDPIDAQAKDLIFEPRSKQQTRQRND